MVQISVGCYHLLNQNYVGCLNQFMKGTIKLKGFRPSYKEINVEKLVNEIELLIKGLSEDSSPQDPKRFWNTIPKLEING